MSAVMGQGEKNSAQTLLLENITSPPREQQLRFAVLVVDDLHVVPGNAVTQTASQGLQKRFLGCEAGGITRSRILAGAAPVAFSPVEEPCNDPQVALFQKTPEPGDLHRIDADAEDHAYLINSTMSRTALSRPTSIAREMIEWPMLYSSMPPRAAIALMLT